jgi:hypothetical protein
LIKPEKKNRKSLPLIALKTRKAKNRRKRESNNSISEKRSSPTISPSFPPKKEGRSEEVHDIAK